MRLEEFMAFEDGRIFGYIFGHPQVADGNTIWTEACEIDWESRVAKSKHNQYELGSEYNAELRNLSWPS